MISPGNFAFIYLFNHRDWRPDESSNVVELTESFHIFQIWLKTDINSKSYDDSKLLLVSTVSPGLVRNRLVRSLDKAKNLFYYVYSL